LLAEEGGSSLETIISTLLHYVRYKCAASIAEKFQSSNDMWIDELTYKRALRPKNFGLDTIKRGPTEGPQPNLEVAAIAIYQWLSNRKYRSADQPSP
jgi:hypothetical protein